MATLEATKAARLEVPGSPGRSFLDEARLVETDIATLSGNDLRPEGSPRNWRPDLLAGGPPCQPFSSAGRQRGLADPRGTLFLEFVRLARELRPRFVLFENVRGLLTQKGPSGQPGEVLQLVQESFEEIGYAVRFGILNAADFGVPQRRVRLYMIGTSDHHLPQLPEPSHSKAAGTGLKPWTTLGSFLAACPTPDDEDVVLPRGERAEAIMALRPGTGIRTGGVIEHQRPSGHWGYRQDSFLADPALPSRTIRAAATPDWVRLDGGVVRRLTWRECAGLQGFPDGWCFSGTTSSRFRQIGNAVCVPVGEALGSSIQGGLRKGRATHPPASPEWPDEFRRRIKNTAMEHRVNGPSRLLRRRAG